MSLENPVSYDLAGSVATITMDDGKANVMSTVMLEALNSALDRAEADAAIIVLAGRESMFSAGYDRAMFGHRAADIMRTVHAGGELVHRLLSFPTPIVASCSGHAIAQGAFILLACDVRIGIDGQFKFGMNEVAIGLTIPHYGVETARHRLTPAAFNHAAVTGSFYSPTEALAAGFLDSLVADGDALDEATAAAVAQLGGIDMKAHAATKKRVRAPVVDKVRAGLDDEFSAVI